jgi:hypothetical protein
VHAVGSVSQHVQAEGESLYGFHGWLVPPW